MLCITERKYVTLIGSKIFLAKHLLFLLLCKICLLFLNEGHQTHITRKNVTPDSIGGGCFYNKLSTDLMFLKPWASKNGASSLLHQVLSWLCGLLPGAPFPASGQRKARLQFDEDKLPRALHVWEGDSSESPARCARDPLAHHVSCGRPPDALVPSQLIPPSLRMKLSLTARATYLQQRQVRLKTNLARTKGFNGPTQETHVKLLWYEPENQSRLQPVPKNTVRTLGNILPFFSCSDYFPPPEGIAEILKKKTPPPQQR